MLEFVKKHSYKEELKTKYSHVPMHYYFHTFFHIYENNYYPAYVSMNLPSELRIQPNFYAFILCNCIQTIFKYKILNIKDFLTEDKFKFCLTWSVGIL